MGAIVVGPGRSMDQGGDLLRGSPHGSAQLPHGPSLVVQSVESRWPSCPPPRTWPPGRRLQSGTLPTLGRLDARLDL
eukprot:13911734-Alexandrium_andersonii.AAC.1